MPEAATPLGDPITFAVIKSAMDAIVDDIAYTVIRTARSEIVKDVMDFSAAICDAEGRWWRRPRPSPSTWAPSPKPWRRCWRSSATTCSRGDAVIMNDPYHGGMHLPDIFMFMPLFFDGKRRAFAVVICHHTDVGGRVPGSNASDSHRDLPGRPAHPAAEALRPRRHQRDAGDADQDSTCACRTACWAIFARSTPPARSARARSARLVARYGADRMRGVFRGLARLCRAHGARRNRDVAEGHLPLHRPHRQRRPVRRAGPAHRRGDGSRRRHAGGGLERLVPQVRAAINSTLCFTKSHTFLSVRCALPGTSQTTSASSAASR